MTLMKYNPFTINREPALRHFFDDINMLFDDAPIHATSFSPAIDIKEDDTQYTITAEMAGIEEKDIDLSFKDGVVTIRGEKKWEEKKNSENHVRVERAYGTFHRSMSIPSAIDEKGVKAQFKNGLLTVTLPKKAETEQVHKIKIDA